MGPFSQLTEYATSIIHLQTALDHSVTAELFHSARERINARPRQWMLLRPAPNRG